MYSNNWRSCSYTVDHANAGAPIINPVIQVGARCARFEL